MNWITFFGVDQTSSKCMVMKRNSRSVVFVGIFDPSKIEHW